MSIFLRIVTLLKNEFMPESQPDATRKMRVLASPATVDLSIGGYARAYYLLSSFDSKDILIDAIVNEIHGGVNSNLSSVAVYELNRDTRAGFFLASFLHAYRRLSSTDYDVYHHMHLGFRGANPVAIAGIPDDTPFLIGPAEAGHDVPPAEVKGVLARQVNLNVADWAVDVAYGVLAPLKNSVVNPVREYLFARTLQSADRVVAVHSDAREKFAEYTDPEKIEVVPYGVDLEKFAYRETETGPDLLTVGNLIRRKGHRYLLRSMPEILAEVPDTHLHVVGTGRIEADLRELVADLGVEEAVTFHGYVADEELLSLFHNARAFVHPSLSEGFSHVRLEAMATGTPVVGTDVDGAHDLTRDGTDGFVVPRRDPDALAEATLELLTDEERAREMGWTAREKVERDHDYTDIGQRYLEIYRELAGETA